MSINVILLDTARALEIVPKGAGEEELEGKALDDKEVIKPNTPQLDGKYLMPNFVLLPNKFDGKNLYHCLLSDEQFIEFYEIARVAGVKYWTGDSAKSVWTEVVRVFGTDLTAKAVVEKSLKVKVEQQVDGKAVLTSVSIADAKASFGTKDADITVAKVLVDDSALPHKFFDGSK
jgi:hypothetical protein